MPTLHQLSGEYRKPRISAATILWTRNGYFRIPRKSLDAPLTPTIECPRYGGKPLVVGIQVVSPIAVKSSSLSAVSLTTATLRHLIFTFLARIRLETIRVHSYESTLSSPTNRVTVPPLVSPSLSFSLPFCDSRIERSKKCCGPEKKICIMPTHIRSHSRIQPILLSNAMLDDAENRMEFIGRFAVMR